MEQMTHFPLWLKTVLDGGRLVKLDADTWEVRDREDQALDIVPTTDVVPYWRKSIIGRIKYGTECVDIEQARAETYRMAELVVQARKTGTLLVTKPQLKRLAFPAKQGTTPKRSYTFLTTTADIDEFLRECIQDVEGKVHVMGEGRSHTPKISLTNMFVLYGAWYFRRGEKAGYPYCGKMIFNRAMMTRGYEKKRHCAGWYFTGVETTALGLELVRYKNINE